MQARNNGSIACWSPRIPSTLAAAILVGISGAKRRVMLSSRRGFSPVSPGTLSPDKIFPAVQTGWQGIKGDELLICSFK
jgi:hypothetical protein